MPSALGFGGSSRGGSSDRSPFGAGIWGTQTSTPGYQLDVGLGPNQALQTIFNRKGTPEQLEFTRRFPLMLSSIDELKGMAKPTASLFRTAALGQLDSAESQTVGNLREQLARRGLSGASFAADEETRARAEFGQQRSEVELAAAQQEIAATTELINFESNLINNALQRELAELGIASGVSVNMTQIASQNASVQAQIAAAERMARAQGQGQFLGTLGGLAAFGGGKNSIFSGSNFLGGSGPIFGSNGWFSGLGSMFGGGYTSTPNATNFSLGSNMGGDIFGSGVGAGDVGFLNQGF